MYCARLKNVHDLALATDLASLCFDGDLKKTNPLTFEFRQKNFKPTHDLNLLFIRKTS